MNETLRIVQSPIKTEIMNPFAKPAHLFTIRLTATAAQDCLVAFLPFVGDSASPLALNLHSS